MPDRTTLNTIYHHIVHIRLYFYARSDKRLRVLYAPHRPSCVRQLPWEYRRQSRICHQHYMHGICSISGTCRTYSFYPHLHCCRFIAGPQKYSYRSPFEESYTHSVMQSQYNHRQNSLQYLSHVLTYSYNISIKSTEMAGFTTQRHTNDDKNYWAATIKIKFRGA